MSIASDTIFTPYEAGVLTVDLIQQRRSASNLDVPTYIPALDAYLRPAAAGELMVVIGRTGNYKSGLMQYIARSHAKFLAGLGDPRCVIYVTWEMAIEEMTMFEVALELGTDARSLATGRIVDTYDNMILAAMRRSELPLWLMGHSVTRRAKRPRLSMTDVENGLLFAADEWGLQPALIVLDYLQRIRPESGYDMRTQVAANVERCKDLALMMGCPVYLGSQARREVMDRRMKIPMLEDGKEAGNIEESADGVLTTFICRTGEALGSLLPSVYPVDGNLFVTDDLMLVSTPKRRLNDSGRVFACRIDYRRNMIRDYT